MKSIFRLIAQLLFSRRSAPQHPVLGTLPAQERIHIEFSYLVGLWHCNQHLLRELVPAPSKIRILLNAADLPKLDACPFAAKLGRSKIKTAVYCVFLYPRQGQEEIANLMAWIEKAGPFPEVTVFSAGYRTPKGQWAPGTPIDASETLRL